MNSGPKLTGATRLYAIIGDPIVQVRSPEVYTEQFVALGVNAVLIPAHVPARMFDTVIPALLALGNLDGLLVTVPYKARMLPFATRLSTSATIVGAINAMRREADGSWSGDMFDGIGFVRAAERKGERLRGRRVLLFGAGGAGSAIACALVDAGVRSIRIVDPDSGRVRDLIGRLHKTFAACDIAPAGLDRGDVDMIVNASPVGMQPGDGMPGDVGQLTPDTLVGDVVISDSPTPLIEHATRHGCPTVTGRDLHAGQSEAIMGFFVPASRPIGR